MENEQKMLELLQRHDPRTMKIVYDANVEKMIDLATECLGYIVAGNDAVTRIWYKILDEDFKGLYVPFEECLLEMVTAYCQELIPSVLVSNWAPDPSKGLFYKQ